MQLIVQSLLEKSAGLIVNFAIILSPTSPSRIADQASRASIAPIAENGPEEFSVQLLQLCNIEFVTRQSAREKVYLMSQSALSRAMSKLPSLVTPKFVNVRLIALLCIASWTAGTGHLARTY